MTKQTTFVMNGGKRAKIKGAVGTQSGFLQKKQKKNFIVLFGCKSSYQGYMSRTMKFPTMWYVRPAKDQISLPIRAV